MANKYENLGHISRSEANERLSGSDVDMIAKTLIAISLHDAEWRWVQQQALNFLTHQSDVVVSAAILSLGHTARINHSIDKDFVIPALQAVGRDTRFAGKVQDAIDDIEMFVDSQNNDNGDAAVR